MSGVKFAIGTGQALRVVVTGANPDAPTLDDVIFDGNQEPLRVSQRGNVLILPKPSPDFVEAPSAVRPSFAIPLAEPTPINLRRFATCLVNDPGQPVCTPYYQQFRYSTLDGSNQRRWSSAGSGIFVGPDVIYGITWNTAAYAYGAVPVFAPQVLIAFVVFKNTVGV